MTHTGSRDNSGLTDRHERRAGFETTAPALSANRPRNFAETGVPYFDPATLPQHPAIHAKGIEPTLGAEMAII